MKWKPVTALGHASIAASNSEVKPLVKTSDRSQPTREAIQAFFAPQYVARIQRRGESA